MGEAKRKVITPAASLQAQRAAERIEHVPADVAMSAGQREQMAALISNLNTARIVAEQFIGYFAKEQGVNLQLYQFDSNRLVFVPAYAPPQPPHQGQDAEPEPEPEKVMNGHADL